MEKRVDAITLLKQDHKAVKSLFSQFQKMTARGSQEEKVVLAHEIAHELGIHSAIEEQILYPAVRQAMEGQVLESLEEHHLVKVLLAELQALGPASDRFAPKMKVLMEMVKHHIEDEEEELFPQVRKAIDRDGLLAIGEALVRAKALVSDTPKPTAADTPPRNLTPQTRPLHREVMAALSERDQT